MAEKRSRSSAEGDREHHRTDWLEHTASIVSGALVLALLALLLWDAFHPDRDPVLEATIGTSRAVGSQHYLSVSVENSGDIAVRDVEVEVTLEASDSTDHATFRIDWLAGKSVRHGVVILPRSPAAGKVRATVIGYTEP